MRLAVCYVLILFAVLFGAHAIASPVARNQAGDVVRLTLNECYADIRIRLPEPVRDLAKAGSALVGGKLYRVCWIVQGDAAVLAYEDGDQGMVPLSQFRDDPGV